MTSEVKRFFDALVASRTKIADVLSDPAARGLREGAADKYSDQAHFVYELLQNADDVKAETAEFILKPNELVFKHDGTVRFTITDPANEEEDFANSRAGHVNSITAYGSRNKLGQNNEGNVIGKFGIGFKSIFLYTQSPSIYDEEFRFQLEREIIPHLIDGDHPARNPGETLFLFPFDKPGVETPASDVFAKLSSLIHPTLFLNNLKTVRYSYGAEKGEYRKTVLESRVFSDECDAMTTAELVELQKCATGRAETQRLWLFTRRDGAFRKYSVGFFLGEDGKPMPVSYKAFCFFPTKHETHLKFIIHAPFLLNESREAIKASEDHNLNMLMKLSDLARHALLCLRDIGEAQGVQMIDGGILNVIPLARHDYQEDEISFNRFAENFKDCFMEERIIPSSGKCICMEQAYWPVSRQVTQIFPDDILQELYAEDPRHDRGAIDDGIRWAFPSIWSSAKLDKDVVAFISSCTVKTPSEVNLLDQITSDFISRRSLDWLFTFYEWVNESSERVKKCRRLPIFLNQNSVPRAAFDIKGDMLLFLPAVGASGYDIIHKRILENEHARALIKRYELQEPQEQDLVRLIINEQLGNVYGEESDPLFKKVFSRYVKCGLDEKKSITDSLIRTAKLRRMPADGESDVFYLPPTELYFPTQELMRFLGNKPPTHFVDFEHYRQLVGEQYSTDLTKLFADMGIPSLPRIVGYDMDWSLRRKLPFSFGQPADAHFFKQKFRARGIAGVKAWMDRVLAEKDRDLRKDLSVFLWDMLVKIANAHANEDEGYGSEWHCYRFVNGSARTFLSGVHTYHYYGENREGFDSPLLIQIRESDWLQMGEWDSAAPSQVQLDQLPDYYSRSNAQALISILNFKAPKQDEAEKLQEADSKARESLSADSRSALEIGESIRASGYTREQVEELIRRDKAEKASLHASIPGALDDSESDDERPSKMLDTAQTQEGPILQASDSSEAGLAGATESGHGSAAETNARQRQARWDTVIGRIEMVVVEFRKTLRSNDPPPPLPDPYEDDEDDDEFTPRSVDFSKRIRNREQRQAVEIATLERGDELQTKALSQEKYTFDWFRTLLDLEMLGKEKDESSRREVSLTFGKMEREPGTERTFVLKHPSRNIPSWLEELSDHPLELSTRKSSKNFVIEVMSVHSYNLRVKLKAGAKVNLITPEEVVEAKIVAQRPTFLMNELKAGFCALPFDGSKNLRKDLTKNIEFVFGPPGTGKTTFLASERIIPIMKRAKDYRILVLAPTNKAADVLTTRIMAQMEDDESYLDWLIRFGTTADETIEKAGLCPGKDVDLKKRPRHVVITTIARFPYDFYLPGNAAPQKLVDQEWDYIVIDEASMIPLVSIVFPLYRKQSASFIIAGDPFQIEPIISCELWKDMNIYTMVELKDFANPTTAPHPYPVKRLTRQYRSIPSIGKIFSDYRYGGILSHNREENSWRRIQPRSFVELRPLTIIKFPVSPYESIYSLKRLGQNGGSSYQIYSALFAFEFARALATRIPVQKSKFRIGVISPYRAQADLVQKLVESARIPEHVEISAGTVHGFQGDECEMIVSLFNPPPGIAGGKKAFINKKNIINVSVSRARDYLVLLMPDDGTPNIENMHEVRKIEALMNLAPDHFIQHSSGEVENAIFGSPSFIEENAFSTGHQTVNVYGVPEMRYEVRTEECAVDIQIHEGRSTTSTRPSDESKELSPAAPPDSEEARPMRNKDAPAPPTPTQASRFVAFARARNSGIAFIAKRYAKSEAELAAARASGNRPKAIVLEYGMRKDRQIIDEIYDKYQRDAGSEPREEAVAALVAYALANLRGS